ncbi:MAG: winged helix-turn-helix domain-containing protein, partial [Bacteroidota bacterium]
MMGQLILLLGKLDELEAALRHSTLATHCQIQAVSDLRQPEVVSLIDQATLIVLHQTAVPRDLPQTCHHLRRRTSRPLIVAFDQAEETDVVAVLAAGADDCVGAPISPNEMIARLRAALRRDQEYAAIAVTGPYCFGDLCLDPARHEVQVRDEQVVLTPREFDLLQCLCEAAGRAVSREELQRRVWGLAEQANTRTLDVHIGRLRQKIEEDPASP